MWKTYVITYVFVAAGFGCAFGFGFGWAAGFGCCDVEVWGVAAGAGVGAGAGAGAGAGGVLDFGGKGALEGPDREFDEAWPPKSGLKAGLKWAVIAAAVPGLESEK